MTGATSTSADAAVSKPPGFGLATVRLGPLVLRRASQAGPAAAGFGRASVTAFEGAGFSVAAVAFLRPRLLPDRGDFAARPARRLPVELAGFASDAAPEGLASNARSLGGFAASEMDFAVRLLAAFGRRGLDAFAGVVARGRGPRFPATK